MYQISVFNSASNESSAVNVESNFKGDTAQQLSQIILKGPWAPATYKDAYRLNSNFESINMLVLDFDTGSPTLQGAKELFKNYKHVIGTSRSHQKLKNGKGPWDRFRVILFLERPITELETYQNYWFGAYGLWPSTDKQCKDGARFYFPCTEIVSINEEGAFFTTIAPKPKVAGRKQLATGSGVSGKGRLSRATKDFLAEGAIPGEWHGRLFKACMDFKEQGYSIEEAALKLGAVTGEWDDHDEQTLVDVYENRITRYEPRGTDHSKLRELVLRSKYIVNIADPMDCLLLEPTTGITLRVHPAILAKIIGNKNDQVLYQQQSVINAIFDYDRFGSGPLYLDQTTGSFVYNQYIPPKWQHSEFFLQRGHVTKQIPDTIPEIYEQFFNHLVDGDLASKEYLIDWMATAMQFRNHTLLTALGAPGVGKGVLGEIMRVLFGEENFRKVRDEVFKTKFNSQLANKALIYIDEIALKTEEDHNRLKDIVNVQIEIERKGKDAISIRNQASYYLSANKLDAIKLEADDRRFSIIQLTDKKLLETPLIKQIGALTSHTNIELLALYLRAKIVSRDMLVPFTSERSADVQEAGLSDWENFVVFEWTTSRVGQTVDMRQLQKDIETKFTRFRAAPGRRKIEELARKYPQYLRIVKENRLSGVRLVCIQGAPMAPLKQKGLQFQTLTQ